MRGADVDRWIAVLAMTRCGVFTRPQVLGFGGTDELIRCRVRQGRWLRMEPGVYALAGAPPSWHQRLWVARLTAEFFAVVSHESAAAFHRWPGFPSGVLSFLVPHGAHPRVAGANFHETRDLWLVET